MAQIVMPRWSKGRVTLVGDACYAVSLIAGQGASLGMAGAYVLADQLASAPTIDQALAGYERLWRPVAEEKQESRPFGCTMVPAGVRLQLLMRRVVLRVARLPLVDRLIPATLVRQIQRVDRRFAPCWRVSTCRDTAGGQVDEFDGARAVRVR